MALYRITMRDCKTALLVSAENITAALNLMLQAKGYPEESVTKIEEFQDIKGALDACYESAEDKLEALLNVLPPCLAFHQTLMRDIAATIVYDATGISGMIAELNSKEV